MLVDSFGRVHDYLRISITEKCNFRCTYCMPFNLPHGYYASSRKMLPREIYKIAKVFTGLGIKKIRLTGGEPLVRKEFPKIVKLLAQLPAELALSTNGVLIDKHINTLIEAGLKQVNISLDAMNSNKFKEITQRDEYDHVMSNIHMLVQSNFKVKINAVVKYGMNEEEIINLVSLTEKWPVNVRFIEYMPFFGNNWEKDLVMTYDKILQLIGAHYSYDKIDDPAHSTSKNFQIKNHRGNFGIITTMSNPFCSDCNRLRLTADGKMKNCLFGKEEVNLLHAVRNNEDITELIKDSVQRKHAQMGGQFNAGYQNINPETLKNRSMVKIGG